MNRTLFYICSVLLMLAISAPLDGQLVDQLREHYSKDGNGIDQHDGEVLFSDLPAILQNMIRTGRTSSLEDLVRVSQENLAQRAPRLYMLVEMFTSEAGQTYAVGLAQLLDKTDGYVKITECALADLHGCMDWYPHDDWQRRFGSNGFYNRVRELQQKSTINRAMLVFYQAGLGRFRTGALKDNIASELEENCQKLQKIKFSAEASGHFFTELATIRLWQARLARILILSDQNFFELYRNNLDVLLKLSLSIELEIELRMEVLRCMVLLKKEAQAVRQQAEKTREWLNINKDKIKDHPVKLLRLSLLQHHLGLIPTDGLTSYFDSLEGLARQYPQLTSTVSLFIAGCLHESLGGSGGIDSLVSEQSDFGVISLGRYYQSVQPIRYDMAIALYESFLQIRPADNEKRPLILYELGNCHYQKQQNVADEKKAVEETVAVIKIWGQLTQKYPRWVYAKTISGRNHRQEEITSARLAGLIGSLAYKLFLADKEKYGDLARSVLAELVGRIEPGRAEPCGPFADTVTARQYRYYYGLTLQAAGQYKSAADIFAAVGDEDENKHSARYYTILCRFGRAESAELSFADRATLYQPWIAELNLLVNENIDRPLSVNAALLLGGLYRETGQIEPALRIVSRVLLKDHGDDQLQNLALNLLDTQRPILLRLHAEGASVELSRSLSQSLPTIKNIYESLKGTPENELFGIVLKKYIEHLSLLSVNTAGANTEPDWAVVESLLLQARQRVDFARQLWFIRCEGLLAFARGDYEQSQKTWYRIRRATEKKDDELWRYYWWEARYFGLRCLSGRGEKEQVAHIIEVLLNTRTDYSGPWRKRLVQLRDRMRINVTEENEEKDKP